MQFITVGDINVHYRIDGPAGAPAVVLVNPLGADFRVWDAVAERLSATRRVVRYDKRGHGLTEATPGDYGAGQLADDLVAFAGAIGIERFDAVGLSVGGLIVQTAATRHADRLGRIVLCNTAAKFGEAKAWTERIAAVRANGIPPLVPGTLDKWLTPAFRAAHPEITTGIAAMVARASPMGYIGTCAALRDADARANAADIAQPTLVIGGTEDGSTPPDTVRDLARRIDGARLEILESAHLTCVQVPDKLAALIAAHLAA